MSLEETRLRRELTQALARSRARFDQSAQPQALLDLAGRVLAVNDAACELLGWSREQLLGRRSASLVHPTDPDQARHQLDRLRAGSLQVASYLATGLCEDGNDIPLRIDVTAVRDLDGNASELAVFARDLSELREAERRLAGQEAFFRGLHREAADVTLVTDPSGALRYVTPSVRQVLGYQPDQVLDIRAGSLIHADDLAGQEERRRRVLEVPGARERHTLRVKDADGRWRWFDTTVTNCLQDPHIAGIVINLREVTPELEAQQALRDSEARYRAIAETAQEGILAVSPAGDTLFANERLAEILGLSMDEVYAIGGRGIFPSVDVRQAARRLGARRRDAGPERSDVPYLHPDGTERVLRVSASPLTAADGSVLGSLAMVSDVTEQRAAEETLRRQALHDALTGLPNRLLLLDRLTRAAARQRRAEHGATAVLFLDLDNFKLVNDSHGHQTGDRLLVEVAARLEQAVRTTDTVARLGGDEFAVICEGADGATAALVAARIQQAFKEPVSLDGQGIEVSMSIGVALSPPNDAEDLLRLADMAMYQAKATARGRVITYDEGLPNATTRRLGVLRALREALDEGSVPLWYQPVVDLRSGQVAGLEAVIHWEHPTLGRLTPGEAARAAEGAGLGLDLDVTAVRTAARALSDLRLRGLVGPHTCVMVHVSSPTAHHPGFGRLLEEAVSTSGLPPGGLVLETAGAALLEDPRIVTELVARLQDAGVGLVLGGPGNAHLLDGRSAVGHLSGLRFRGLVIDQGIVEHLTDLPTARAAARAVVELARTIGGTATAQGIETEQQADLLRELGCDLGTGPFFGPSAPLEETWRSAGETSA